jgi:ABC-2 type transport system permease protein
VAVAIVAITGLCIGWRPHASAGDIIAAFAVALLFAYALSWCCACLGIVSKGPESAQGVGLVILFPLAIVSNAMVPTTHMPAWLRDIANWNPVSSVVAAVRHLMGNPNPVGSVQAWPMEHPVLAAVIWSVVLIGIAAPLAGHLFRKKTVG